MSPFLFSADDYAGTPEAVVLLRRLKLIWTRVEQGEFQIRIPPGTTSGT